MAQIKVIHDPSGEPLTIYRDNPEHEEMCEELGQAIILIKNAQGAVIGIEWLYFRPSNASHEMGGLSYKWQKRHEMLESLFDRSHYIPILSKP